MVKSYPGPQVVSKRIVTDEALPAVGSSGLGAQHGLTQPANSIIEKIYIRVLEAPVLATAGDIGFEAGTETATPFDNIISNTTGDDNLLDGGTTLPVNTLFELTSTNADTTWAGQGLATGDAASETASNIVTEDTEISFEFKTSTNVDEDGRGKFEVSFVFRVFE